MRCAEHDEEYVREESEEYPGKTVEFCASCRRDQIEAFCYALGGGSFICRSRRRLRDLQSQAGATKGTP